jgi:DnaJ-class molecular chaperone
MHGSPLPPVAAPNPAPPAVAQPASSSPNPTKKTRMPLEPSRFAPPRSVMGATLAGVSPPAIDLYAVLGVSAAATTAELRRAYRRLALEHHPDRAGPQSAPRFAQIAEAYSMLSNPTARAAYDAHQVQRGRWPRQAPANVHADGQAWNVATNGWSASWRRPIVDLLSRLTGPIDTLVEAGVASVDAEGTLELRLSVAEALSGGTVMVTMPLRVICPTCGGVARAGSVWCRRCEFAGQVTAPVPVQIRIPPAARNGALTSGISAASGELPRVRLRIG